MSGAETQSAALERIDLEGKLNELRSACTIIDALIDHFLCPSNGFPEGDGSTRLYRLSEEDIDAMFSAAIRAKVISREVYDGHIRPAPLGAKTI